MSFIKTLELGFRGWSQILRLLFRLLAMSIAPVRCSLQDLLVWDLARESGFGN